MPDTAGDGVLLIDPDALRAAVASVSEAADALAEARDGLADAEAHAQAAVFGRAHHKTSTFVRQWREECERLAEFLVAYQEMFVAVAAVYEQQESDLAACLVDAPG